MRQLYTAHPTFPVIDFDALGLCAELQVKSMVKAVVRVTRADLPLSGDYTMTGVMLTMTGGYLQASYPLKLRRIVYSVFAIPKTGARVVTQNFTHTFRHQVMLDAWVMRTSGRRLVKDVPLSDMLDGGNFLDYTGVQFVA